LTSERRSSLCTWHGQRTPLTCLVVLESKDAMAVLLVELRVSRRGVVAGTWRLLLVHQAEGSDQGRASWHGNVYRETLMSTEGAIRTVSFMAIRVKKMEQKTTVAQDKNHRFLQDISMRGRHKLHETVISVISEQPRSSVQSLNHSRKCMIIVEYSHTKHPRGPLRADILAEAFC